MTAALPPARASAYDAGIASANVSSSALTVRVTELRSARPRSAPSHALVKLSQLSDEGNASGDSKMPWLSLNAETTTKYAGTTSSAA